MSAVTPTQGGQGEPWAGVGRCWPGTTSHRPWAIVKEVQVSKLPQQGSPVGMGCPSLPLLLSNKGAELIPAQKLGYASSLAHQITVNFSGRVPSFTYKPG